MPQSIVATRHRVRHRFVSVASRATSAITLTRYRTRCRVAAIDCGIVCPVATLSTPGTLAGAMSHPVPPHRPFWRQ
jgi:hypothetical protein